MKKRLKLSVSGAIQKLSSQWPIDKDRAVTIAQVFEDIASDCGIRIWEATINRMVKDRPTPEYEPKFPTAFEMREWINGTRQSSYGGLSPDSRTADRRQHANDYFGEADVVLTLRMVEKAIADKKPIPSQDEIHAAILDARSKFGFYKPGQQVVSTSEFEHYDN